MTEPFTHTGFVTVERMIDPMICDALMYTPSMIEETMRAGLDVQICNATSDGRAYDVQRLPDARTRTEDGEKVAFSAVVSLRNANDAEVGEYVSGNAFPPGKSENQAIRRTEGGVMSALTFKRVLWKRHAAHGVLHQRVS